MARRQREIFAHENRYEKNVFEKIGSWFRRLKTWQKGLLIGIFVCVILLVGIGTYVYSKLNLINRVELSDGKLSCVDVDGYVNILLLGVDTRDMNNIEGAGADAIMILSIKEETGEVKLMSVYRDTYLKMGDEDYYDKITNANRVGGPELMIQSLNQAMDLNISKFAVVNFKAVADLVDAVGGITVNIEEYEIEQLNKYTKQTANNIGKEDYQLVTNPGEQTIEGVQAVSYGRIRKGVGDDYKRTERMRIVLNKVFEKVKTLNINELNDLVNLMIPQVQTNLSNKDIFSLAARLVDFNIQSGAGWPYDVTSGLLGGVSYVFPNNLYANTVELHEKMFGQENYQPSDLVLTMSDEIIAQLNAEAEKKKTMDTRDNSETNEPKDKTDQEKKKDTETKDTSESTDTSEETKKDDKKDQSTEDEPTEDTSDDNGEAAGGDEEDTGNEESPAIKPDDEETSETPESTESEDKPTAGTATESENEKTPSVSK